MAGRITDPRPGDLLTARLVQSIADAYRWFRGFKVDPSSGLVGRHGPGGLAVARSGWPDIDAKLTGASSGTAGGYLWHHVTPAPGGVWDDDMTVFGDDTNGDVAYEYTGNNSIVLPFVTRLSRIGGEWRFAGYSCV